MTTFSGEKKNQKNFRCGCCTVISCEVPVISQSAVLWETISTQIRIDRPVCPMLDKTRFLLILKTALCILFRLVISTKHSENYARSDCMYSIRLKISDLDFLLHRVKDGEEFINGFERNFIYFIYLLLLKGRICLAEF